MPGTAETTAAGALTLNDVTDTETVAVADVYVAVSVGVNVLDRVWLPAASTVPDGGVYTNVPATPPAVAFNCVALSAVPLTIAAGFAQVMVGVICAPVPLNGTICGLPAALSAMLREALSAPTCEGVN